MSLLRSLLLPTVLLVAGCSHLPPPPPMDDTPAPAATDPAAEATDATLLTPPAQCLADANHCCMPDGTLVIPGGCSSVSDSVLAGVEHGAGGWCETVACDTP